MVDYESVAFFLLQLLQLQLKKHTEESAVPLSHGRDRRDSGTLSVN